MLVEGPFENGNQPVVIALRQRIVFMAVATGAFHRQSEHGRTEDVDFIRDDFETFGDRVDNVAAGAVGGHSQKTGGDQVVGKFLC